MLQLRKFHTSGKGYQLGLLANYNQKETIEEPVQNGEGLLGVRVQHGLPNARRSCSSEGIHHQPALDAQRNHKEVARTCKDEGKKNFHTTTEGQVNNAVL